MSGATCPVCASMDRTTCLQMRFSNKDAAGFECQRCGKFEVSSTALIDCFGHDSRVTKIERAALSYRIRNQQGPYPFPMITTNYVEDVRQTKRKLPSPSEQASNIIRLVGNSYQQTGDLLSEIPRSVAAEIGSVDRVAAMSLVRQLVNGGLIEGASFDSLDDGYSIVEASLTLAGWQQFEAEERGKFSGKYGFVALKFGDAALDSVLVNNMKPAVAQLGYDLIDMRDRAEAGLIDNLMRSQIRDSAFVIADLTHDNFGAYWEAGFAEGLNKPVLYICEKSKFQRVQTHFDTNHCTTVLWDPTELLAFERDLKATLRRSLNLFDEQQ